MRVMSSGSPGGAISGSPRRCGALIRLRRAASRGFVTKRSSTGTEHETRAPRHAKRQGVRPGNTNEMIAEHHAAGARHVARNDGRSARNGLAQVVRDEPRLAVDAAPRRLAGEQRDGLASEIV